MCFHSISFPSEWGVGSLAAFVGFEDYRFHSISFPSEWGGDARNSDRRPGARVSIQLVSPASGETLLDLNDNNLGYNPASFHSISFPSEWGGEDRRVELTREDAPVSRKFPFN